ncbi:MFS transporter [Pseudogemmobacter faecipullorum]|uniref:MFS transporter n=1 Tax=Pseudogemmobacter faecipullorum TaxID=2755041 RepID=A0ABS8CSK0_9RHOB|nr:MFS transporter [Pseudogemmobacter faecipullorum]MCB5412343.1 MFS transporter [Pseudogemmobacter faecipullorum]
MFAARRWPVISALGVVQIFTWGSSYYLLAVLASPIEADTDWPMAWVVGAISVALVCAGLASPKVGRAISHFGGRPVLAAGCTLLALGLVVIAAAPNLPVFYAGWCVIGLGMGAGLYDPAFATLGRLYKKDARAAITALTLWGGFASTVCWPLSTWLLDQLGWRGAAASYAAIHLLICLPLIFGLIPKEPRHQPAPDQNVTGSATLLGPERMAFLVMALILVTAGLAVTVISVYLLKLLQAQGLSTEQAVTIGAFLGPAQVAARVMEMAGKGRHHPIWTLIVATASVAMGLVLLALDMGLPGLAVICYGAGNGIFSIARGALPLALFGPERYPALMGRLALPSLLAQAAAPILGVALIASVGAGGALTIVACLAIANLALSLTMWATCRHLLR